MRKAQRELLDEASEWRRLYEVELAARHEAQQRLENFAGELARVKELGLAGVEIRSNIEGANLGEPRFRPFFKEAERLGLARGAPVTISRMGSA